LTHVDDWRWEKSDTSMFRVISVPKLVVEHFQDEVAVDIPIELSLG